MYSNGCISEGCSGNPDVIKHSILVGTHNSWQPYSTSTLSENSDESSCGNCWLEPELPPTVKAQSMNAVGVFNDAGNAVLAIMATHVPPEIFTFLNYDESPENGNISLQSLTVMNKTNFSIGVNVSVFSSCTNRACLPPQYGYNIHPSLMMPTGQPYFLPTPVSQHSTSQINLTPSGYRSNPENVFAKNDNVDIQISMTNMDTRKNWPDIFYSVK